MGNPDAHAEPQSPPPPAPDAAQPILVADEVAGLILKHAERVRAEQSAIDVLVEVCVAQARQPKGRYELRREGAEWLLFPAPKGGA